MSFATFARKTIPLPTSKEPWDPKNFKPGDICYLEASGVWYELTFKRYNDENKTSAWYDIVNLKTGSNIKDVDLPSYRIRRRPE